MHESVFRPITHDLATGVEVWWVTLDTYAEVVPLTGTSPAEHDRVARQSTERNSRRQLASRHALRSAIGRSLGQPPQDLTFELDEFGKPHLTDHHHRLHFNLSHSGPHAVIGLSHNGPIGVDIEEIRAIGDADALVGMHFTSAEQAEWRRTSEAFRNRAFLTCWTRKEACAKALGVGLSAPPVTIDVGCAPDCRSITIPAGTQHTGVRVCSLTMWGEVVAAAALTTLAAAEIAHRQFCKR